MFYAVEIVAELGENRFIILACQEKAKRAGNFAQIEIESMIRLSLIRTLSVCG